MYNKNNYDPRTFPYRRAYAKQEVREKQRIIRGGLNRLFVDGYPPGPKKCQQILEWTGCSIFELAEHLRRGAYASMVDFSKKGTWHLDHVYPLHHIPLEDYHLAHWYKNLQALPPNINEYKQAARPMNLKENRFLSWREWVEEQERTSV
jgi:hypothetical protein